MISPDEQREAKQLIDRLTASLERDQAEVLNRATKILGTEQNLNKFHGFIAHKSPNYVDIVRGQFSNPEDFFARWIAGLVRSVQQRDEENRSKYGVAYKNSGDHNMVRLLDDQLLMSYIERFLERTFYRQLAARKRAKPHESLWSVWFGSNPMVWGLLIAPTHRQGRWINDESEIRRAPYMYWTVGHVLHEGLIDPQSNHVYGFKDVGELLQFYRSVLKRVSYSIYEKQIVDRYEDYLKQSSDPLGEPLLVPEFRYDGDVTKHTYRLDYSVFNSHVMEFVGFELSPVSTHMQVTGTADRSQKDINLELAKNWEKEIGKRNVYFQKYDVPVVTFTDSHLQDIDACFSRIAEALAARSAEPVQLELQLSKLNMYRSTL